MGNPTPASPVADPQRPDLDPKRIVVLLSGGMDSAALLYWAAAEGLIPFGLSFDYGQRHSRELKAARQLAARAGISHTTVDLSTSLRPVFYGAASSQVGRNEPVPLGHYADPSMKTTLVPNRNMILLSLAGAFAISRGIKKIGYAAHAGDHPIYPDCRPEFADVISTALDEAWGLELIRPFIEKSKTDIAKLGSELKVPFDLTYSCYQGRPAHCGRCGTCVERREAFRDAGIKDPSQYEAA